MADVLVKVSSEGVVMSIHELLNILVLTLSLATVFITLLTYLIYKIRQLPYRSSRQLFFAILCLVIFLSIIFERNISHWKLSQGQKQNSEIFKN